MARCGPQLTSTSGMANLCSRLGASLHIFKRLTVYNLWRRIFLFYEKRRNIYKSYVRELSLRLIKYPIKTFLNVYYFYSRFRCGSRATLWPPVLLYNIFQKKKKFPSFIKSYNVSDLSFSSFLFTINTCTPSFYVYVTSHENTVKSSRFDSIIITHLKCLRLYLICDLYIVNVNSRFVLILLFICASCNVQLSK